jgi:excinuclease ABC subunit A
VHGGEVVAEGTPVEVEAAPRSLTGAYLRGDRRIEVPASGAPPIPSARWSLRGARGHNLAGSTPFPLGCFVAVTGVSGSGKSSLVNETLYRALARHFHRSKEAPLPYDGSRASRASTR